MIHSFTIILRHFKTQVTKPQASSRITVLNTTVNSKLSQAKRRKEQLTARYLNTFISHNYSGQQLFLFFTKESPNNRHCMDSAGARKIFKIRNTFWSNIAYFGAYLLSPGTQIQEPAVLIACDDEQCDLFLLAGQHGKLHALLKTTISQQI